MVRRHLLPPGRYQTFEGNTCDNDHHNDSMARILPKPLTTDSTTTGAGLNLSVSQAATIQVNRTPKCQVRMTSKLRSLLLEGHRRDLEEGMARQMMPPPPAPPRGSVGSRFSPPPFKSLLNAANLLIHEGEVEFYKNDGCKSESSSSHHEDDFDDLDEDTVTNLGRTTTHFSIYLLTSFLLEHVWPMVHEQCAFYEPSFVGKWYHMWKSTWEKRSVTPHKGDDISMHNW